MSATRSDKDFRRLEHELQNLRLQLTGAENQLLIRSNQLDASEQRREASERQAGKAREDEVSANLRSRDLEKMASTTNEKLWQDVQRLEVENHEFQKRLNLLSEHRKTTRFREVQQELHDLTQSHQECERVRKSYEEAVKKFTEYIEKYSQAALTWRDNVCEKADAEIARILELLPRVTDYMREPIEIKKTKRDLEIYRELNAQHVERYWRLRSSNAAQIQSEKDINDNLLQDYKDLLQRFDLLNLKYKERKRKFRKQLSYFTQQGSVITAESIESYQKVQESANNLIETQKNHLEAVDTFGKSLPANPPSLASLQALTRKDESADSAQRQLGPTVSMHATRSTRTFISKLPRPVKH